MLGKNARIVGDIMLIDREYYEELLSDIENYKLIVKELEQQLKWANKELRELKGMRK
jgi:hypothetical protein